MKVTRRAVFSPSFRGRIGKTFWGGHYADFVTRRSPKISFKAFDPDNTNASFKAFFPKAEAIDIAKPLDLDRIFESAKSHSLVFCDGLGGHYQSLADWIVDVNLYELAQDRGVGLTFVIVITDNIDTIKHAAGLLDTPPSVNFLIVRNSHFSPDDIWEKTKTRKDFLARKAIEFRLPRNHSHVAVLFDELKKPAFTLASTQGISSTDQQRFLNLGRLLDKEFEAAASILLPPTAESCALEGEAQSE